MEKFIYYEINIFTIIMLIIIMCNSSEGIPFAAQSKHFRRPVQAIILILIIDILNWMWDGIYGPGVYVTNALYFILTGVISMLWFIYTYKEIYPDKKIKRKTMMLLHIPMWILIGLSVSSPATQWLFYVNEAQQYVRGPLFFMQFVIGFGYIGSAAIFSLFQMRREILVERKKECMMLAAFIVFPVIGGSAQLAFYGVPLLWPSAALALLIVYIGMAKREISIDALTLLNNRGRFNRYLSGLCDRLDGKGLSDTWLLIMDVDEFKNINDTYGHFTGDLALQQVAKALKYSFSDAPAFLSRYGGDEFAVLLECKDESEVQEYLKRLNSMIDGIDLIKGSGYKLSLSIGYSRYGTEDTMDIKDFISLTDSRMYLEKQRHRELRQKQLKNKEKHPETYTKLNDIVNAVLKEK